MIMKILSLIIVILVFGSVRVEAQGFSALLDRIENSLQTKNPQWKLTYKEVRDRSAVYIWKFGNQGVQVSLYYLASPKEAEEKLSAEMNYVPVSPTAELKNLGDKAYLYKSYNRDNSVIRFIASNVYIQVGAPSRAMAESVAQDIVSIISHK